jgi:hypothetical protein
MIKFSARIKLAFNGGNARSIATKVKAPVMNSQRIKSADSRVKEVEPIKSLVIF